MVTTALNLHNVRVSNGFAEIPRADGHVVVRPHRQERVNRVGIEHLLRLLEAYQQYVDDQLTEAFGDEPLWDRLRG
jgi:hypothetical protein